MIDKFTRNTSSLISPVTRVHEVVPNDILDLPFTTKVVYVDADGNITFDTADGQVNIQMRFFKGFMYDIRLTKVYSTGTQGNINIFVWD